MLHPATQDTTLLDGQPFHLHRWGARDLPVLLMLHGFPEHGGAWADLAPHLAHRFHCIAPDQRGYGRSYAPTEVAAYATARLAGDMAALIRQESQVPVTVLGHDWGAAVAYALAAFHPQHVDRLIIANGVHPIPFQRALAAGGAQTRASLYINLLRQPGAEAALGAADHAGLIDLCLPSPAPDWLSPARLAQYRREWSRGPGRLATMLNWYRASPWIVAEPGRPRQDLPDLPADRLRIPCPHLLLWGTADTALLPEATRGLETHAPQLTRRDLPGLGHWLHHEAPARVAAALLDWLDSS